MKESNLRKSFMPEWQEKNGPLSKLFRNNTGSWIDDMGRIIVYGIGLWRRKTKKHNYRPVGGGDLIGWTSTTICEYLPAEPCRYPDKKCIDCSLNKQIAIFTSIELKTKNVTMTKDQKDWKAMVIEAGGIAEEVREDD